MTALSLVPDGRVCVGKPGKLDEIFNPTFVALG